MNRKRKQSKSKSKWPAGIDQLLDVVAKLMARRHIKSHAQQNAGNQTSRQRRAEQAGTDSTDEPSADA